MPNTSFDLTVNYDLAGGDHETILQRPVNMTNFPTGIAFQLFFTGLVAAGQKPQYYIQYSNNGTGWSNLAQADIIYQGTQGPGGGEEFFYIPIDKGINFAFVQIGVKVNTATAGMITKVRVSGNDAP